MDNATNNFYDAIAEYYPLFYKDWETQLEREGLGLKAIFRDKGVKRVLDAACGIGTQSIPLAKLGYDVTAIDPSAGMLQKARQIAIEHDVLGEIQFEQADFAHLSEKVSGEFDAILCKGNALPHLLTDEEIEHTLYIFSELLRPGGLLILGLRDFEQFMEYRPRLLPGFVHDYEDENQQFITFDVWDWDEGPPVVATQNLFIIKGIGENYKTIKRTVSFRPLSLDEVRVVLLENGFEEVHEQPDRWEQVLVARKPE